MKLDVNSTECVRTVSDFYGQTIHNICNGTEVNIPWGSVDVFLFSLISLIIIAFVLILIALTTMVIKDTW